jgi:pimeloyl-ACP methyl ester carboxylesterase
MEPTFALLHSPLAGPSTWATVAGELTRRGCAAMAPSLTETGHAGPYWERHAEAFAQSLSGLPARSAVVLVGHSGAGALLPAIGHRLSRRIGGYVLVDGRIPDGRRSRLELLAEDAPGTAAQLRQRLAARESYPTVAHMPYGDWIPDRRLRQQVLDELRPRDGDYWTERIPLPSSWPDAPCGYLGFTPEHRGSASRARRLGWAVVSLDAGHFHMLVEPAAVSDELLRLARRLLGPVA